MGFALLVQWGARKDNFYLLGVYDLLEEAVYSTVQSHPLWERGLKPVTKVNTIYKNCRQKAIFTRQF